MQRQIPEFDTPESFGPNGPWYVRVATFPITDVFRQWCVKPNCLLLDSATSSQATGRYGFLMANPTHLLINRQTQLRDWQELEQQCRGFQCDWSPDAPPFFGGAAGLLSYDWCRAIENIPLPQRDDFQVPALAIGIYDSVIVWDHIENDCWIIASGFPCLDLTERKRNAIESLKTIFNELNDIEEEKSFDRNAADSTSPNDDRSISKTHQGLHSVVLDQSSYQRMPQLESIESPCILTASSNQQYRQSIETAKRLLREGDIFQVNLAQQLIAPLADNACGFYQRLREQNPAPMMAYFDSGNHQIVSASPERLFSVRGRQIQTRPIKGTCPRTGNLNLDQHQADELRNSEKNCAENIMIVDLLRNDLSKVCRSDSVRVTSLCELEPYQYVQHLTSVVEGELNESVTAWDVMPAIFPGGSISGAPKVRAMEIINELEPVARGAYCGSIGYISFEYGDFLSNADWNILIRTATVLGGWCQIPVGGGIVLDSQSDLEFRETLDKAKGMLVAISTDAVPPSNPSIHGTDDDIDYR